jgi:hypothetical protein
MDPQIVAASRFAGCRSNCLGQTMRQARDESEPIGKL